MDKLKSAKEIIEKDLKFFKSICHPYNPEDEGKREKIDALTYLLSILERLDEERMIKAMDSRQDYVNDSGDGLEELSLGEILNSTNIDKLATAIHKDIVGE